jgi:mono/diheme cytochrome c family protein
MSKRIVTVVLAAIGIVAAAPAVAQDKAQVDRGMKVFAEQKCSQCHSIAGKGNAKGAMDDVGLRASADEIRAWITTPKQMTEKAKAERKPPMKEFPDLAKADVDALVVYLQTLKKKK